MNLFILLQGIVVDTVNAGSGAPSEESMSYFEIALKGGWVMLPILILSFIAIYIFFERFFTIQKAARINRNFMDKIRDYIYSGKIDSAVNLCQSTDHPTSRMIEKGISRIGRPLNDINTTIENVGRLEINKLEKGLPVLATVAGGAPMLGFLGTVMGMIKAFYDMSMVKNNIDISLLSSGIYQALVTTVAGLIVGILAYFAYNILVARVEKVVSMLESHITEFMDLLNEPAK
ncbi:MAG: MotA/TolQ/ExbB proton channel family protein [Bacteroidales bacterium]|nr:MotA/TolQ/ExbB proton channel family protein [Bacteroidales bacterium]